MYNLSLLPIFPKPIVLKHLLMSYGDKIITENNKLCEKRYFCVLLSCDMYLL